MRRPFIFQINAAELFAEISNLDDSAKSKFITQLSTDLITLKPVIPFSETVIQKTLDFIEKKSAAGKLGGRPKKAQVKHSLSTPEASPKHTLTYKNKNKEKEYTEEEKPDEVPYSEIIAKMNELLGTNYRPVESNNKHIKARWNEGFRQDDFARVCINKKAKWGDDPNMAQYLRPATLFGPKFDAYLNEVQPETQCTTPVWL